MITQSRLKQILTYNSETGIFHRISNNKIAGGKTGNGYILIGIDKKQHYAHRLAWLYMTGEMPVNLIDHKNMDKADNRFSNLREATYSQNIANKKCMSKSGFKGVTWWDRDKKWKAQIYIDGKNKHLGYFDNPELAHQCYCFYQNKIAGEFANA
jgi:hypothetical protein